MVGQGRPLDGTGGILGGAIQILPLALGNESLGPVKHKMAVGSAIEALVEI